MKAKTSDINPTSPNKEIRVFIRNVFKREIILFYPQILL